MSTSGITGGGFSQLDNRLARTEQLNTDSKQLGGALKNDNVAADPEDFVTLSQDALSSPIAQAYTASTASSTNAAGSSTQSAPSAAQDFQTLGEDLQSGNLSGALRAFAQIELGR